ncbi:MAG TPA: ornithine carbamoyltransferase [Chthonomonadales bacterium]|nr:ornithine carbamoyltransferase [Chthonomonadales bacterium]
MIDQKGAQRLWQGRSLVSVADITGEQFEAALDTARLMKAASARGDNCYRFANPRTLALLFEKPSLRTRVSFEAGMTQLGGAAIHLSSSDIGINSRESSADVAAGLSRWVDIIAARVYDHTMLLDLKANATVPVINALSDMEHPCQTFADLLTVQEQKGPLGNGLKLAYVGDGNNVLHSLLIACALVGVNVSAACPPSYGPKAEFLDIAERAGRSSGARVDALSDPLRAVTGADVVYTDVWTSMGEDATDGVKRAALEPFRVDRALMAHAAPDAIALHCLPAHPGEEISQEVYQANRKVIFDQAENRLHTQKALLSLILAP